MTMLCRGIGENYETGMEHSRTGCPPLIVALQIICGMILFGVDPLGLAAAAAGT